MPDGSEACPACGQRFDTGLRGKAGQYRRKTLELDAGGIKSGDLLAGRYEIRGPIGNGPLGVVFRARDREVDVEVALKVIAPNLLQSADERAEFLRSLKQAKRLAHPNLVRVYDAGQIEATATLPARAFFTSQLLEGMTLRRVIQLRQEKGQVFSVHETEPILAQSAQALEHAYRLGPHGDLKPENVMVLPDLLKVMDFGVASAIPRAPFLAAQRQRKADAYIAPEVLGGHAFDQSSDMYAVGVILGEMLAGVVPSSGSQPPELRERQRSIPTVVEAIYRRAANPDPSVRYSSPGEFAGEMFNLAEGLPTRPPPQSSKVEGASTISREPRFVSDLHLGQAQACRAAAAPSPRGDPLGRPDQRSVRAGREIQEQAEGDRGPRAFRRARGRGRSRRESSQGERLGPWLGLAHDRCGDDRSWCSWPGMIPRYSRAEMAAFWAPEARYLSWLEVELRRPVTRWHRWGWSPRQPLRPAAPEPERSRRPTRQPSRTSSAPSSMT